MKTDSSYRGTGDFYNIASWPPLSMLTALLLVSLSTAQQLRKPTADRDMIHLTTKKLQQIYTAEIGVREKQPNSGPEVEKYLRYVNLPPGNPWCAAFVCWVYGQAGVANPRTGWSPDLFRNAQVIWKRGLRGTVGELRIGVSGIKYQVSGFPPGAPGAYLPRLVTCLPDRQAGNPQPATPTTGDVFGIYFPEKKRIAHVGFIDQWDGSWLITVEGNTNDSGSREGDGVYRKRRLVSTIYKVARYVK